jgi:hypothetical protein
MLGMGMGKLGREILHALLDYHDKSIGFDLDSVKNYSKCAIIFFIIPDLIPSFPWEKEKLNLSFWKKLYL